MKTIIFNITVFVAGVAFAGGIASEYVMDGLAVDGSGRHIREDARVIVADDFSDYGGDYRAHIKHGGEAAPRRWIGRQGMRLDGDVKYTGTHSLRLPVQPNIEQGITLQQWLDTNALRGKPMNDEPMTGDGNMRRELANLPGGIVPTYDVRHREGGYEHLFVRAAVRFEDTYTNSVHTGIGFSGGYFNRPNPTIGASTTSVPHHPGSSAGYRANGYDRFIASAEFTYRNPYNWAGLGPPLAPGQPGWMYIYFYGAEQVGLHGNLYFSDGSVIPSTGGDNTRPVNRAANETQIIGRNGSQYRTTIPGTPETFTFFDNYCPPLNEWFVIEYELKLNTVEGTAPSPGANFNYRGNPANQAQKTNAAPAGSKEGLGPQPVPNSSNGILPLTSTNNGKMPLPPYKVHADGVFRVWADGRMMMEYKDIVIRHTNEMFIDLVQFSAYFRNAPKEVSVWYDNIIVATEYIGPVNKNN